MDAVLDFIGDVRHDLHGVSQEVAAAFLADERFVDLARGGVVPPCQAHVREAFIVAQVQVGLRAVVRDVHFAVLERTHGPRIDVQIRVEFLQSHPQAAAFEQQAQRCGCNPLPEGRHDAAGHENIFHHHRTLPWKEFMRGIDAGF